MHAEYTAQISRLESELANPTQDDEEKLVKGITEALTLKTPCCDRALLDFDGCTAVGCSCNAHFCAWCFEVFRGDDHSAKCHAHVMRCSMSMMRVRGEASFYCQTFDDRRFLHEIWTARRARQLKEKVFGGDFDPPLPVWEG